MKKKTIAICFTKDELQKKAEALATELKLPLTLHPTNEDYLLILTPLYLGLKKRADETKPLYIDLLAPTIQFRGRLATLKNESVVRALGLKNNTQPKIIDATGGLLRDSFIIASLGFEITVLERSPIIHALIRDGLERAKQKISAADRIHLIKADAIDWLPNLSLENQPDIIYLDPMFEERKKSALPKKEMLIFHDLVNDEPDAKQLLVQALACAKQRVVVKRARLAPYLSEMVPAYSLKGNSCRFDVYLIAPNHKKL
jgi:16S rRNA (guanine1516-N2)-methyltransferase